MRRYATLGVLLAALVLLPGGQAQLNWFEVFVSSAKEDHSAPDILAPGEEGLVLLTYILACANPLMTSAPDELIVDIRVSVTPGLSVDAPATDNHGVKICATGAPSTWTAVPLEVPIGATLDASGNQSVKIEVQVRTGTLYAESGTAGGRYDISINGPEPSPVEPEASGGGTDGTRVTPGPFLLAVAALAAAVVLRRR